MRPSDRLEALGRLAGGMVHNVNNLLTVIHGHGHLLLDRTDAADPGHGLIAEILRAGERAAALAQQLSAQCHGGPGLPPAAGLPVPAAESLSFPDLPSGTETLLLVEGEGSVRALARRILEIKGYRVLPAARGGEAMALAARHQVSIDLLVADLATPPPGGPELAGCLAASRPEMKVLYLGGCGLEAAGIAGMPADGFPLLPKPFTPRALARKVRELLDG